MRTVLLASVAALALSVAPAMAQNSAGSHGFINKSANSAGGNAASTGGSINTGSISPSDSQDKSSSSGGTGSASSTTGGTSVAANGNAVGSNNTHTSTNTRTTSVNKSSSASSTAGGAASATTGGVAVNKNNGNTLMSDFNPVTDTTLDVTNTHTTTDNVIAEASASGSVSGNHTRMEKAGFSGLTNTMTNSVNGQGILSAQQNTGANALQQVTVSLGSVVGAGGTGFGASTNSAH